MGWHLDDEILAHLLQAVEAVDVRCTQHIDGTQPVQSGAVRVDVLQNPAPPPARVWCGASCEHPHLRSPIQSKPKPDP